MRPSGTFSSIVRVAAAAARFVLRDPTLLLAAVCAWFAVRAMLAPVHALLASYDDALLFLNAQMLREGRAIYRDFYSNYPPGIFQLIRGIGALGLPEIWTMRGLTFLVHVSSALLSGRIVALVQRAVSPGSRSRICWPAAACVLCLQASLGCVSFAYCYGLLLVQIILLAWPEPGARRSRFWLCGALLGVLSYFRHDVAVYVLGAWGSLESLGWILRKRSSFFGSLKEALQLLGSAALTAGALWLPIFARAGFGRVLHDLLLDVSKLTMPARVLPIPPLWTVSTLATLNSSMSAFQLNRATVGLILSAIALLVGVLFAARVLLGRGALEREQRLALLLIACGLATIPQALGRTDSPHVAFVVPLTMAAGMALWSSAWARSLFLVCACLPWFTAEPKLADWITLKSYWINREQGSFMSREDAVVAAYVQSHTAPREAIYVGCTSHARLTFAPLSPYYWSDRPGATRFMQLDPGLATTTEGQTTMIGDLERSRPSLVLRFPRCWWEEPNGSRLSGSTALDEYFATHYQPSGVVSSYAVWKRKPG